MLRLGPKLKKLKRINTLQNIDTIRYVGGLNLKTLNLLKTSFNEFLFLHFFRYKSYKTIEKFKQPDWCFFEVPDLFYDDISYYSIPSKLNNKTPEKFKELFSKLGLNLNELNIISKKALDIVFDSISIIDTTTHFLIKNGIFFMSFFESINLYSYLVFNYLGTIIPIEDNFYVTLNSIIFNGGSFCYIPKEVKCNINLSTYFRTNSEDFAQFERTLLIVGENSSVVYIEGCSAPIFLESQLHVALVEILVKKNGKLNYSTIQNWYRGDQSGEGGLYNFTTKRGWCLKNAILNWIQIEIGSAITWKYPSTYLIGEYSSSDFFSLSLLSEFQITDTGNKMLHIGSFTKSKVYSKSISLNNSFYTYRGLVKIFKNAKNTYNYTECNSLIFGNNTFTSTIPYIFVNNYLTFINQEATISKIELDFIFFLLHRGIDLNTVFLLLIYGFCENICSKLPIELELEIPILILMRTKSNF